VKKKKVREKKNSVVIAGTPENRKENEGDGGKRGRPRLGSAVRRSGVEKGGGDQNLSSFPTGQRRGRGQRAEIKCRATHKRERLTQLQSTVICLKSYPTAWKRY